MLAFAQGVALDSLSLSFGPAWVDSDGSDASLDPHFGFTFRGRLMAHRLGYGAPREDDSIRENAHAAAVVGVVVRFADPEPPGARCPVLKCISGESLPPCPPVQCQSSERQVPCPVLEPVCPEDD